MYSPTNDSSKTGDWEEETSCKVCLLTCCTQGNIFLKGWNSWLFERGGGGRVEKPLGNLITDWTKAKHKALPMRMLLKTMGPLKEMELSGDNNPPSNSAHIKYYIIAILAKESLFTGQLRGKPSVTAPRFPLPHPVHRHSIYISRGSPRKEAGRSLSLPGANTFLYSLGGEAPRTWTFPRNWTPQLKGDRPLQ